MSHRDKIIKYIRNGYSVIKIFDKISDINVKGGGDFYAVFPIDKEIIESPKNRNKSLIFFGKGGENKVIVTSDKKTIEIARRKQEDQNTRVGTQIHIDCNIIGTDSCNIKTFDYDKLNDLADI